MCLQEQRGKMVTTHTGEARELQSSSGGRWKLAGSCGVHFAASAAFSCCPGLEGGVVGKDQSISTGSGCLTPGTPFLLPSRPCKIHFETVSNCKMPVLEWQTQGCHKRERLYSYSLLSWHSSDWGGACPPSGRPMDFAPRQPRNASWSPSETRCERNEKRTQKGKEENPLPKQR